MQSDTVDRNSTDTVWPLVSLSIGGGLVVAATTRYPDGYRWSENTVSALFQPMTPSGLANPAQSIAASGVIVVLIGVALLFDGISRQPARKVERRLIQVGGIGCTISAALVLTPLHDLMALAAVAAFTVAVVTILGVLYADGAFTLFALGVLAIAMELATVVLYFGQILPAYLPPLQKSALLTIGAWLFMVHWRDPTARRVNR